MAKPDVNQPAAIPADPRILLIRLKSIGDVIFTLPAANVVRDNFPSAKITFLTSKENALLLRGFGMVNEVITLDRAALRCGNPLKMAREIFSLLKRLRAGRFSLALDFQGYGETEFLAWWSGAAKRWGNVYKPSRGRTYTHVSPRDKNLHPAEWNLALLRQGGLRMGPVRNEYLLPAEAIAEARRFFVANNLDAARPVLYLQPFTSSPKKNWPLEKYVELARFWHDRGVQIIFSGGPGDRLRLEPLAAGGMVVAAGVPRLTDAGLMKLSTLVIGGDTGFLHLAVALGKRVLMLIRQSGPGAPVPLGHADWAVAPPGGSTLEHVGLEQVLKASMAAFADCGTTRISTQP